MPKREGSLSRIDLLQAIRVSSNDGLQIEHGSSIPLFMVENRGWLASEWRMSEANRRAKYYKLTPTGKKQMPTEQSK